MNTNLILSEIIGERARQENGAQEMFEHGLIHFPATCATAYTLDDTERLAILADKFGDVSKNVREAICGRDQDPRLRASLIETAAVCVAWVEGFDAEASDTEAKEHGLAPGAGWKKPTLTLISR